MSGAFAPLQPPPCRAHEEENRVFWIQCFTSPPCSEQTSLKSAGVISGLPLGVYMTEYATEPAPQGVPEPFFDDEFATEIDRVAARLRTDLDCDSVFVNVPVSGDRLFSIGVGLPGSYDPPRLHSRRGSLCDVTAQQDDLVRVADARLDPVFQHAPQVSAGQVVAYLGHPVADSRRTSYGAICATSLTPRDWTGSDAAMLASVACIVGSLFLIRQLRQEAEAFSDQISEADRALLSLSRGLTGLISVHGELGEALFLTAELTGVIEKSDLERTVREILRDQMVEPAAGSGNHADAPKYIGVYENAVAGRIDGQSVEFTLQLWQSAADTFHAYWKRPGIRLADT